MSRLKMDVSQAERCGRDACPQELDRMCEGTPRRKAGRARRDWLYSFLNTRLVDLGISMSAGMILILRGFSILP